MLQDTPPEAIVAVVRRVVAGRGSAVAADVLRYPAGAKMEEWTVSAAVRRRLPAERGVALLVPGARDDAGGRPRACDSRAVAGRSPATRGSTRRSTGASGTRRGFHPDQLAHARGFRVEGAGRHQVRPARCAIAGAPVRRLPVRCRTRGLSHPWHVRHDRPADGVRRSVATTGMRSRMRTRGSVGHGHPPRATRCSSRRSSAFTWARGGRSPARSGCAAEGVSVRRRGARHDRARRAVARPDEAVGVLRDAVVRAASRRSRARGRLRSASLRAARRCSSRASRGRRCPACATGSRRVRRARDRLRIDGRDDARS